MKHIAEMNLGRFIEGRKWTKEKNLFGKLVKVLV
jgi:hypothetical protein